MDFMALNSFRVVDRKFNALELALLHRQFPRIANPVRAVPYARDGVSIDCSDELRRPELERNPISGNRIASGKDRLGVVPAAIRGQSSVGPERNIEVADIEQPARPLSCNGICF